MPYVAYTYPNMAEAVVKKKHSFDASFKLKVVEFAEKTAAFSNHKTWMKTTVLDPFADVIAR